jgi:hypothetical protein
MDSTSLKLIAMMDICFLVNLEKANTRSCHPLPQYANRGIIPPSRSTENIRKN